ncbi:hypothetical protein GCM10011386_38710 [Parapedobacter defluvii]|uniref:DUF3560 domain-containing protein n=1 Tax=Parapedobacter defluvii TaxID=2045106 RepID=A0ABQ1MNA2_9SPHI|nr:DUF3560 domain-containing protein [Parapedobacter defluvii]GGC42724.1 hypothetical protein GCM10011386_38710 [Parapedobacter defluvii]
MKHDFEERRQKRIMNAKNRAKKNEQEAESLYKRAEEMAGVIPFGQPILVGHHSEKRDRNYREKIYNTYGKSFEKQDKATYYEEKAETIESNTAIFSDDPQALQKLEAKLKELQDNQDFMKATNRFIKKKDKAGFLALPYATEKLWEEVTTPNVMGDIGFAHYKLSNNNANIRRIKQRIEQLRKREQKQPFDKVINGVRIVENIEANRLQMVFDGKPNADFRKQLKSNGFRWSPTEGAWQRHISNWALHVAKEIVQGLNAE